VTPGPSRTISNGPFMWSDGVESERPCDGRAQPSFFEAKTICLEPGGLLSPATRFRPKEVLKGELDFNGKRRQSSGCRIDAARPIPAYPSHTGLIVEYLQFNIKGDATGSATARSRQAPPLSSARSWRSNREFNGPAICGVEFSVPATRSRHAPWTPTIRGRAANTVSGEFGHIDQRACLPRDLNSISGLLPPGGKPLRWRCCCARRRSHGFYPLPSSPTATAIGVTKELVRAEGAVALCHPIAPGLPGANPGWGRCATTTTPGTFLNMW